MFAAGKTAAPSGPANYVEDVFSTYLYTGNGTTQTITNNIDLAGKGGLVWTKSRSATNESNIFIDTARGVRNYLASNTTNAQIAGPSDFFLTQFNSNGYVYSRGDGNQSGFTYASWTFRKQPKFFDIRSVSHTNGVVDTVDFSDLGTIGCIIYKDTGTSNWIVWHRTFTGSDKIVLNLTDPIFTSTAFSVSGTTVTISAAATTGTKLMYAFAHDAGGFGLTGNDNVISCGTFTTDASSLATVTLNYEPQYVMVKRTSATSDWLIFDTMRGFTTGNDAFLRVNTAEVEGTGLNLINPTATGFTINFSVLGYTDSTFVYIAIRRPMKVPTLATTVFSPQTATGVQSPGFATDALFLTVRAGASYSPAIYTRLTGSFPYLLTSSTAAEAVGATTIGFETNNGVTFSWPAGYINHYLKRAPGFFDVVCYTGNGTLQNINHNLNVAPELIILKPRNATGFWSVYAAPLGNTNGLFLGETVGSQTQVWWNNTSPTASIFTINGTTVNQTFNYVAYLFATCPGVSKVGSYTGTGALQTVACGFTSGARFIMIKRTDSTGDWYVWDSARGITSGTDPYFLMNSIAAEVTNTDYVDTDTTGFKVTAAAPAALNAVGGTYIFLAIA